MPKGVLPITTIRRRLSQSELLEYLEKGLTLNNQILHEHPYRTTLQLHRNDVTSFYGRKLSRKIRRRKCRGRRIQVEFLKNGLSEDHKILRSYCGQPASQTCRI